MSLLFNDAVELHLEDWVQKGIDAGQYFLQGGVVRKTIGRKEIVYWLKPGDFVTKAANLLPGISTAITLVGIGVMQINFAVVNRKLDRLETLTRELGAAIAEVARRQYVSAVGKAKAGCQLAHEAAHMTDGAAVRQQLVMAKGSLLEADVFFADEFKRADPLFPGFMQLLELLCQVRLSYIRCCVMLGDHGMALEYVKALQREMDSHAMRCMRAAPAGNMLGPIDEKLNRVNEVLAVGQVLTLHQNELEAVRETSVALPYPVDEVA